MSEKETAYVDPKRCDRATNCRSAYYCPRGAMQVKTSKSKRGLFGMTITVVDAIEVDERLCDGCGTCVSMCPHEAVSLRVAVSGREG